LWLAIFSSRADAQTIHQIPSPRADGAKAWMVDTTGTISEEAIAHINTLCEEVHQKVNKEIAVVVISSTSGQDQLAFGTDLFNLWGVGKTGYGTTFREDGILFLAAINDRRAAIALGNGIDDDGDVRNAQQIIDDVVIPLFAEGDPHSAMYEGTRACATRLLAVADLDSPVTLPSVAGREAVRANVRQQQRRGFWSWFPWILGFAGIGGIFSLIGGRYYLRYRARTCPHCSAKMVLLCEEKDDEHLADPEVIEEQLGSVNYDVWACRECDQVLKIRYGKLFTRYSKCPKCWYITVYRIEGTVIAASYSHGGKVRVNEECKACHYHRTYYYHTPKKVRPSSSSSSGGWSSGGGGGRSSSGFGGGSSSGRGASGGW